MDKLTERQIERQEYLLKKREEVLKEIKPMCEVFGITDYDYIVEGEKERLKLNYTYIGCDSNSISATINEVVGYIFITVWCRKRTLGAFGKQFTNYIKRYWIK